MSRQGCNARYEGGQWVCYRCHLNWDFNDPEPPQCRSRSEIAREWIARIKKENGLCGNDG